MKAAMDCLLVPYINLTYGYTTVGLTRSFCKQFGGVQCKMLGDHIASGAKGKRESIWRKSARR
jgi:hypothetical protein